MSRTLKLLTFDAFNTIIKIHRSPGYQYALVANQNGVKISPESIDGVYRDVWKAKKTEHPTYGVHHGFTAKEWWEDFVCRVFIRSGYTGDSDVLRHISTQVWFHFQQVPSAWDVLPHAVNVLQEVRRQGYRTALISNFDQRLANTMKILDLHELFDFLVTCVDVGASKPDPAIYLSAVNRAGLEPGQVLHVGDSVNEDYWAATNAGLQALLLNTGDKLSKEELNGIPRNRIITNLQGLIPVLENI